MITKVSTYDHIYLYISVISTYTLFFLYMWVSVSPRWAVPPCAGGAGLYKKLTESQWASLLKCSCVLSASVTIYMYVCVWLNVCCVEGGCGCVWRSEVVGSPGVEVTDCCGLQCGCWGLNSGPLLSLALCLRHCLSSCLDSSWGWNVTRKHSPNKSCPPPSWLWTAFSPSDRTAHQDKCRPFYVRCTRF